MASWTYALEFEDGLPGKDVIISNMENGTEQRQLRHDNPTGVIRWRTPPLTQAEMATIWAFIDARDVEYDDFTWTLPATATNYNVRFDGTPTAKHSAGHYVISGAFKIISKV